MKDKLAKIRPYATTILLIFILISVILTSHSLYENKRTNFATPDALTSLILKDMDIRISDLARENFVIHNRTFDNCRIYGPAVIYPMNCLIKEAHFTDFGTDSNAVFIITTNKAITGIITLDTCVIKNCTFYAIGLIGSYEDIEHDKTLVNITKQ